jgi:membrane protein DedA with SNARE-associated domain
VIKLSPAGMRRAALVLVVLFALPTLWFAMRSYGSFLLLRSAYEAGAPKTSSIRPWMTLTYIAGAYHVPASALMTGLGLPSDTDPNTSLRTAATQAGLSPFQYVERVQRGVAALAGNGAANAPTKTSGWLAALGDQVLSELLVYGYPVLGLSVLLGTVGLPLPQGLATTLAGSLAAQGRMSWIVAGAVVVVASILGDLAGYGVGRLIGRELLDRYGRWLGYTPVRVARAQRLFAQWGLVMVFVTRTFVSYLSSVASLLAGVSRYGLSKFVVVAAGGRVVWTAAYLGLGYVIGADLDAATGFLSNLSGFLLCGIVLVVAGLVATMSGGRLRIRARYTMS